MNYICILLYISIYVYYIYVYYICIYTYCQSYIITMSRIENNLLMELPFSNLTDFEFRAVTGSWHFDLNNLIDIDLFSVIPNPDKFDQRDPDNMLSLPSSNYYSINKLNNYLNMLTNKKSISLFHCNIRSLPKNLNLLEEFIYSLNVKPDILAISETKLNDKTIINTDIRQYQFFHTDSKTAAGGAGLYISKDLHAIPRPDIKFNMELVESCWSEIINNNKPNVIISLIKLANKELSIPFTFIYNQSFIQGIVPDILKISRVTPVFKNGITTNAANYRPIAILSPFSKILEKIISDQLNSFLEKIIFCFHIMQFGFRKDYSTELAILEMSDNLKTSIDKKLITCGLFLDFSKAFDTVNHDILLDKLEKYGVRGIAQDWFRSYLHNRYQYVKIGNIESSLRNIICGIPQGSTLGPLLFLLYINDLPNSSTTLSFRLFADDANIFYASKNLKEIETVMNNEFQNILKYCNANKLSINMQKTHFMLIRSSKKTITSK